MAKRDLSSFFKEKETIKLDENIEYEINCSIKAYTTYTKQAKDLGARQKKGEIIDDLQFYKPIIVNALGDENWEDIQNKYDMVLLQEISYTILSAWTGHSVEILKEQANEILNKKK